MQMIRHCIDQCWDVLQTVSDPEIPVLSVVDLGMIRGVEINDQQEIIVRLTPTYSGCPATDMLKAQIVEAFTASFDTSQSHGRFVRSMDHGLDV